MDVVRVLASRPRALQVQHVLVVSSQFQSLGLFIIFVCRFCDRLAHAEDTCCRGEAGW